MVGRLYIAELLFCGIAMGQVTVTSTPGGTPTAAGSTAVPAVVTTAPGKPYAFDVISIRQNKTPPTREVVAEDGATADGYRSHQTLLLSLVTAYVPQVGGAAFYSFDQIKGIPDWLVSQRYDVDARIAEQDRAEWQKPDAQKRMLQSMLQAMLGDRCKLVVHREVKETQVSSLAVARGGPKFKDTDPAAEHPGGQKLPFGGVIVLHGEDGMSFYDTSMGSLASFLSSLANQGRPVQDKTGLAGRYDFTLKFGKQSEAAEDTDSQTPLREMILTGLSNLGLKLDAEKGQVETLVIDHMERPSED